MLFIASKGLGPVHVQGEGITQGCESQGVGIIEGHPRACLPCSDRPRIEFSLCHSLGGNFE